jgi:hypothetical protein
MSGLWRRIRYDHGMARVTKRLLVPPMLLVVAAGMAFAGLRLTDRMNGIHRYGWTEEVRLEDGRTLVVKRNRKLRIRKPLGGPTSVEDLDVRIRFTGEHAKLPVWRQKDIPLVVYHDDGAGEWVIVASSHSIAEIDRHAGMYWEYRSSGEGWREAQLSLPSLGRETNLYLGAGRSGTLVSADTTAQDAGSFATYGPYRRIERRSPRFRVASASDNPVGEWRWENSDIQGEDRELCAALFEHVRTADPQACQADALRTFGEFSELPWQSLDKETHLMLGVRALLYDRAGPRTYFRLRESRFAKPESSVRLIKRPEASMKLWKGRLVQVYEKQGKDDVADVEQSILMLTTSEGDQAAEECVGSGHPALVYRRRTLIAGSNLQEPDPRVGASLAANLSHSFPMLYRGNVVLIDGKMGIWKPTRDGLHLACRLHFKRQ